MIELHKDAIEMVNQKFNIVFSTNCRNFDCDLQQLSNLIDKHKKDIFLPNDRILLSHMDTDYYDDLLPCGLLIINLIRMFKQKNIPLYLILFVTNHYGIKKEFDMLLQEHHINDRPTVVETLLSPSLLSTDFNKDFEFVVESIEKPGLCMMGHQRSHRVALSNFLKNQNLLPMVALKTNFK